MSESVRAYAPATVSNLGCAFDVMGFAVEAPGDEVVVNRSRSPGIRITAITGDGGQLPQSPGSNTAGVAVGAFLREVGVETGLELEIHKGIPLGGGMGSSAASAAAALIAVDVLLGTGLTRRQLLPFALEAERAACGSGHADNAAPSLLGGLILIRSYDPLDVQALPVPAKLWCGLVHPDLVIRTEEARRLLSPTVQLRDAVTQWGNLGGLVTGLFQNDYSLIGRSLRDVIIEPQRSRLIPGFAEVKKAAEGEGALGSGISGSGPSLFALCDDGARAERCAQAMSEVFGRMGIPSRAYVSRICAQGAKVIARSDPP